MPYENKGKRVEFKPPKDFKPPEDSMDKEWDMVCSFRTKPGGMICMTKLGEMPMPGYDGERDEHDEDRESDHKPSYSRMADSIISDLGESGAPAPDSYNS